VYCPRCGTENDHVAKFCKSCGFGLGAVSAEAAAETLPTDFSEIDVVRRDLSAEYEILEELGRGGMAIVFRAREKQLDREVAVKVLPFSLAFDREFVERFQREARTAAKLEHPNIIPIYRVGRTGRTSYFTMKLLRGKPLATVLDERGALAPVEIRDIMADVCRALSYAHRSNTVHRDIKPDNIMFDEHGHAVVTDFGIAKAASGGRLTETGMAIGTPHFMSPEQARAQPIDGRSDLYSLGVVAYLCLAGSVPFDGEDSFSIGYKHIMDPLPEPELRTADQREVFAIIRRLMAKAPDDRFQSADEVLLALGGAPVLSRARMGSVGVAAPAPSGEFATRPTTPMPRVAPTRGPGRAATPEPRRSVASGLFIFLVVIGGIVAGGGYWAHRQGLLPGIGLGRPESTRTTTADSVVTPSDTTRLDHAVAAPPETAAGPAPAPGRLLLRGVPEGARVLVDGQPATGNDWALPAGAHGVSVVPRAGDPWVRQIVIESGQTHALDVPPEVVAANRIDSCAEPGPVYNLNNECFDSRPVPLTAPIMQLPADAPMVPRATILQVKVSPAGQTVDVRVVLPSNDAVFTQRARSFAEMLSWNPAQKGGTPVEGWTQLIVKWERQP